MSKIIARVSWLAVAGLAWSGTAGAGIVTTCPDTAVTTDNEFVIEVDLAGATCLRSGTGNINGNKQDEIIGLGYTLLDKSDDGSSGVFPNAISIITGSGITGHLGSFSFSAPGFKNFVVGFKIGGGQGDPDWAAFTLPAGVTTVVWEIFAQNGLSHINLYGNRCEAGEDCDPSAVVPLPAAAWLLLSGMVGLFGISRRRRAP